MGIGLRYFIFDMEDNHHRISESYYEKLKNGDITIPFDNQKVRVAIAALDTKDRKAVAIRHIDCSYLYFDIHGKIDKNKEDEELQEAVELVGHKFNNPSSNIVKTAKWRTWKLSERNKAAIVNSLLLEGV